VRIGTQRVLSCYRNLLNETLVSFQGLFPPGQGATIGVDFMIKTVEINGEKVKVGAYGFQCKLTWQYHS